MSLNVISNFAANVAHRNLVSSDMAATNSLAKLSAGTRVLSAKDDAASMAIGNRLAAEVAGLRRAGVNAGQAVSMLQVADGAQARVNDVLIRLKSLSVQSASAQLSDNERGMIDTEYQALISEIDRIAKDTDFSGNNLVAGEIAAVLPAGFDNAAGIVNVTFQGEQTSTAGIDAADATISYASGGVGADSLFTITTADGTASIAQFTGALTTNFQDGSTMTTGTVVNLIGVAGNFGTDEVSIAIDATFAVNGAPAAGTITLAGFNHTDLTFKVGTGAIARQDDITVKVHGTSVTALGLLGTGVDSRTNADLASQAVSEAIDDLQVFRAEIGAAQNRLEFAGTNIKTILENTESARSTLLDLDVAAEMSVFVSKQVLVQAGVSMLAQANQLPQNLLRLFQ